MRNGVLIALTAALVTAGTAAVPAQAAQAPSVTAREAYLVDTTQGTVQFAKRETRRVPIASLTKVMTAYVVRRQASLNDVVTVTAADIRHATAGGATTAGLRAGERLTVRDLLYGLLLPSGADAAHALAERYGPGTAKFVARMNAAARALGLRDTRYANPDGLPSKAYSTARDQATLAVAALRDPVIASVAKTPKRVVGKSAVHRAHVWRNTNDLLDDGAVGLKTGFTSQAGYCLSFAAVQDGHTYVGVVLGERSEKARLASARKLLDWAETGASEEAGTEVTLP
ncbi:D-alanyl-D-alanine carboxypeptidase family protein [Microbispora bryophytorum]|uniref:D-alanyl-D-alanine carboxypeptidase n=1 Tax=Microbispora bryophytorum TaxID=1460882 RepID=A0A8H9H0A9_9ACTN|nr:serine hydrolase [Microbispora bryophytorum]MBD3139251.1 D-alanyl-D-alanine carboxypeptidase [Microbispora bryophytorum]TQS03381.1 D-alanyl-D-alanine carboxypeptidase [Microbispora bryophytorum]GGO15532.1 D-alanyl-D-alanine carboxypeptidase [Microbispora bryophytorum]